MIAQAQRKVELLESHATDHFHSIHSEGTRAYALAKEIMLGFAELAKSIECAIAVDDFDAIDKLETMLSGTFTLPKNSVTTLTQSDSALSGSLTLNDWSELLEELFQIMGKHISHASKHAAETRGRARKFTIQDLALAGIDLMSAQGKKLTATLRRIFSKIPNK